MARSLDGNLGNVPVTVGNGRFAVGEKLSAGCFGEVYLAKDVEAGEEVAVKFEDLWSGYLEHEVNTLKALQESGHDRPQGFTRLLHSGVEANGYRCMVMERLGGNLLQHMNALGGRLDVNTALIVGKQAVPILEYLHSKRMVHRDIKPENFATGLGCRAHHLYLVDFGLAIEYHTGRAHVPLSALTSFQGNFRYAARAAHRFQTQGRRDDLEALAYMLIFLVRGSLPWSGIHEEDWRVKSRRILEMKEATKPVELCEGLPTAFAEFLEVCHDLDFQDQPDYQMLRQLFMDDLIDIALAEDKSTIEDTAVQWVDSSPQVALVPLRERAEVRQPEDLLLTLTRTWNKVKSMSSRRSTLRTRTPSTMKSNRTISTRSSPSSDSDGNSYAKAVTRMSTSSASPEKTSPESGESTADSESTSEASAKDEKRRRDRLRRRLSSLTLAFLPCGSSSGTCRGGPIASSPRWRVAAPTVH